MGSFRGRVTRWGAGGFGFITVPDLGRDVYFNDRSIIGPPPAVGDEVQFEVLEFPGDKFVARSIRGPTAGSGAGNQRTTESGVPLRAGMRGVEALSSLRATTIAPVAPAQDARSTPSLPPPTTLDGAFQAASSETLSRVLELRTAAAELEQRSSTHEAQTAAIRDDAARKRVELEREIARIERDAEQRIAALARDLDEAGTRAAAMRQQIDGLERGASERMERAAVDHLAGQRRRFQTELERRDRATTAVHDARAQAMHAVGEDVLRKYEEARRRVQTAQDADDREAFALLERQRRQTVLSYAEAADEVEGWATLELPLWLTGSSPQSAMSAIVVPIAPEDAGTEGPSWRVACAFLEGVELARRDLAGEGAATIVERGSVAGCLAVQVDGLDTELLPLLLDDALGRRPSLTRLGVKLRWEEAPHVRLPVEVREEEVATLDTEGTAVTGPATGGSTREVATRLGMDLPEIVTVLVARGLPFPDDVLERGAEESLRSLLGLEAFVEAEPPSPSPAPEPPPGPSLAPELEVAGRIVAKLLRKHVIGGKHTAIQNVYGHHFSDADKDLAKTVTERLILAGVLMEKQSVGARHVSMNPRMIPQARALADHGRVDDDLRARLVGL